MMDNDSEELTRKLRSSAPVSESRHELVARTNRERAEAANAIGRLQSQNEELSRMIEPLGKANRIVVQEALLLAERVKQLERELEQARKSAKLYRQLRSMHWTDKKLVVISAKDVSLGVQTYSGNFLDDEIARQQQYDKEG